MAGLTQWFDEPPEGVEAFEAECAYCGISFWVPFMPEGDSICSDCVSDGPADDGDEDQSEDDDRIEQSLEECGQISDGICKPAMWITNVSGNQSWRPVVIRNGT
jgi:hypothetical protein